MDDQGKREAVAGMDLKPQEVFAMRVASVLADFNILMDGRLRNLPTEEEQAEERLAVQVAVRAMGIGFKRLHDKLPSWKGKQLGDRVQDLARGFGK